MGPDDDDFEKCAGLEIELNLVQKVLNWHHCLISR